MAWQTVHSLSAASFRAARSRILGRLRRMARGGWHWRVALATGCQCCAATRGHTTDEGYCGVCGIIGAAMVICALLKYWQAVLCPYRPASAPLMGVCLFMAFPPIRSRCRSICDIYNSMRRPRRWGALEPPMLPAVSFLASYRRGKPTPSLFAARQAELRRPVWRLKFVTLIRPFCFGGARGSPTANWLK